MRFMPPIRVSISSSFKTKVEVKLRYRVGHTERDPLPDDNRHIVHRDDFIELIQQRGRPLCGLRGPLLVRSQLTIRLRQKKSRKVRATYVGYVLCVGHFRYAVV